MSNGISDTQNPQATIAHLRALLEPALDEPLRYLENDQRLCIWCDVLVGPGDPTYNVEGDAKASHPHAPTCPVLERDHILGRRG